MGAGERSWDAPVPRHRRPAVRRDLACGADETDPHAQRSGQRHVDRPRAWRDDRRTRLPLRRWRRRQRAATLLIATHGPGVLGYLRVTMRDRDAADEAFAQSCENIWKGIGSFRHEASLRTWAYRMAWHAALQQLRDPFRRHCRAIGPRELDELVVSTRSQTPAYRRTVAHDRLARLRAAMDPGGADAPHAAPRPQAVME